MCNTRKDAAAAAPGPMPRSLRRTSRSSAGNAAAATSSAPAGGAIPASTGSAADSNSGRAAASSSSKPSTSSTSSAASLASLREYLPESPTLYPFSEICSATNNFLAKRLSSSSSSSNSWRCTLRGKDAVVFQRRFRGDPGTVRRRLAATCKIHYSSIARLLGASLGGEHIYLVYEYVNGASLAHCLRNPNNPGFTPLSTWVDRMQVATDIAQGLEYIHHYASIGGSTAAPSPAPKVDGGVPRHGPVHNRITSSAVMVTDPQLRAKICHFGASELAGEIPFSDGEAEEGKAESPEISEVSRPSPTLRRSASRDARFEGTRGYIAPEVLGGGAASQKSDVFAFGVVLLELLTGEEPVRYGYNKGTKGYDRVSLVETAREVMGAPGEAEAERERQGRLRRWVDRRLKDSYPAEVAEKALRVALECVGTEPGARPDMMRVAGKLSHLLVQSRNWAEKMRVPADFSVSMAPR